MTIDLSRPRQLGALFADSLRLYMRNFRRFIVVSAGVVIPTELIVSGVGLGELSRGFSSSRPASADIITLAVQALVTTPLVVAMTLYLLADIAEGREPSLRRAVQSGLDAFAPLFLPVTLSIACTGLLTLGLVRLVVSSGSSVLVPLLAIPLILGLRLYFVPQSVVTARARGLDALRASWELTRGFGLRVFGVVFLGYLVFSTLGAIAGTPLAAAARSANSGALLLAARIVGESLAAPAVALLSVLLYFDLRARRSPVR